MIHIIGGGLAGCEAAWQSTLLGVPVTLHEMRPQRPTAVHKTDRLAELVCSNSFRGDKLDNAVGLLKEEMRNLNSLIMRAADASRVPAGTALAVDRERFAQVVTELIEGHPLITLVREEVLRVPKTRPLIIATGPLTTGTFFRDVATLIGSKQLYFYDAISPIVLAETINHSRVFRASRWNKNSQSSIGSKKTISPLDSSTIAVGCGTDDGQGDYLNCPLTKEEYDLFYGALIRAESATVHDFDKKIFF
jgi:methylenetetrahydrofolate--tRNA-(uracil-5-)-methyltransferase